jgi:hypothetical protein
MKNVFSNVVSKGQGGVLPLREAFAPQGQKASYDCALYRNVSFVTKSLSKEISGGNIKQH